MLQRETLFGRPSTTAAAGPARQAAAGAASPGHHDTSHDEEIRRQTRGTA